MSALSPTLGTLCAELAAVDTGLTRRMEEHAELLKLLRDARTAMREEESNQEKDIFGFNCPRCYGALPMPCTLGCRIDNAILKAERP